MKSIFSGLFQTRKRLQETAANDYNGWKDRLITADVGVKVATEIVEEVRSTVGESTPTNANFIKIIARRLRRVEAMIATASHQPFVILVMGVNGSGKTTTIAKLSHQFTQSGKKVLLAAGDTFRAAAREQLERWASRVGGLEIDSATGDPASVAFSAVKSGIAKNMDIVIIDTAGRLSTQPHLMEELSKIRRAVNKAQPHAPHELLLILDSTIGQNAIAQVKAFKEAVGVTGLIITKIDGSSKGGFLLPIAAEYPIPIRYAGVGEQMDDLALFDADEYANALIGGQGEEIPT